MDAPGDDGVAIQPEEGPVLRHVPHEQLAVGERVLRDDPGLQVVRHLHAAQPPAHLPRGECSPQHGMIKIMDRKLGVLADISRRMTKKIPSVLLKKLIFLVNFLRIFTLHLLQPRQGGVVEAGGLDDEQPQVGQRLRGVPSLL